MTEPHPRVAVVAAAHNRAARLADLLASLREQTLPATEFEVVIVDDGSTDETPRVLADAQERRELRLTPVRLETGEGPAAARNAGWRAASAPLIAFTDDDCVADPGWLEAGLRAVAGRPGAVIQGRTDPMPHERDLSSPFTRTVQVDRLGPYYQTCNIFYPRELLELLEGFDQSYGLPAGEDTDLAWRAIEAGRDTAFAPDARVFHAVNRLGPAGKLRQAMRWGTAIPLFARHPELRRDHLHYRVFWNGWHYLFARFVLALLLRHRVPRALTWWLGWPYVAGLRERTERVGASPLLAPWFVLYDVVEVAAVVRGAIRHRTFVL